MATPETAAIAVGTRVETPEAILAVIRVAIPVVVATRAVAEMAEAEAMAAAVVMEVVNDK